MLVRDVDTLLDMRLVLRLRQTTELFDATKSLDRPLPVFIYENDGMTLMSTYFPKPSELKGFDLLLRRFNAVELEDSFVTTTRINNVRDLSLIKKLLDLPSVVLNRADMSGGFLNVYLRFHSEELMNVSSLLTEYTSDKENSRVEWLGPSPGITHIMDLINSQYPMSLVTYEIDCEGAADELAGLENALIEVKGAGSEDRFNSVLYFKPQADQKTPEGAEKISSQDGVFSYAFSNRFLSVVRGRANSSHIIRMRFFVKLVNGRLRASVFLPTSQVYDYYSILYEVERSVNNSLVVRHLMPYSDEIWNFV